MRSGLRKTLGDYNDLAIYNHRRPHPTTYSGGPGSASEQVFDRVRRIEGVSDEIQHKTYDIQEQKQSWMRWVRMQRQQIKDGQGFDRLPESLKVEGQHGRLFVLGKDGRRIPVTLGQLVADLDWGKVYWMDPSTVDPAIQQRYIIAYVRRKLEHLRDIQVEIFEGANKHLGEEYKAAFHGINTNKHLETPGFIAERLLSSFFTRMEYDARPPYKFERADPYQDAYQKIDFLFHFPDWVRGASVHVTTKDQTRPMSGVQLSVGGKSAYRDKRQAIRDARERLENALDDIALVFVRSDVVMSAYTAWQADGCPPGGPEAYLSAESIQDLLLVCFEDLVTPEAFRVLVEEILRARGHGDARRMAEGMNLQERARSKSLRRVSLALEAARDAEAMRARDIRDANDIQADIKRVDEAIRELEAATLSSPAFASAEERVRFEGQVVHAREKIQRLRLHRYLLEHLHVSYQEQRHSFHEAEMEIFRMLGVEARACLARAANHGNEDATAALNRAYEVVMQDLEFQLRSLSVAAKDAYKQAHPARALSESVPSERLLREEAERFGVCVQRMALILLWTRRLRLQRTSLLTSLSELVVQEEM